MVKATNVGLSDNRRHEHPDAQQASVWAPRTLYVVESIRRFPKQEAFTTMIRTAGFDRVTYRNPTGGTAAIYSHWRI